MRRSAAWVFGREQYMPETKVLKGFIGEIPSYLRQALEKFARDNQSNLVPVSFELTCEAREHIHPANDATGFSHDVGC